MTLVEALRVIGGFLLLPVLVGTALLPPSDPASPAAGFQIYHYGSEVAGTGFREVFLVHAVTPGFQPPARDVTIRLNGEILAVTWADPDGTLSLDDRFWFVQEAFDQKQVLTGEHGGSQVMECRFGGGAGLSIHPDEWRAMGMPEEVRCLQITDDQ